MNKNILIQMSEDIDKYSKMTKADIISERLDKVLARYIELIDYSYNKGLEYKSKPKTIKELSNL